MVTDLPEIDEFGFEVNRPQPKDINPTDNRPVLRVARGAVDQFKEKTLTSSTLMQLVKAAVPPGVAHTIDDVDTAVTLGSSLVDSVSETLGPEITAFKRNVRRLLPNVKEYVPRSILDKIEKAVEAPPPEDDYGEYDADTETINTTLRDIFDADRIQESFYRDEDEARETVRDGIQRKFNAANLGALEAIRRHLEEEAEHRDTVVVRRDQKILELQYRQYFTQRDLLAETISGNKTALEQLQAIVKNTALSEEAKKKLYEHNETINQQNIVERAKNSFRDYSRMFQTRLHEKITEGVGSLASNVRQGLQAANTTVATGGQMATMAKSLGDEIDPMKEAGSLLGDEARRMLPIDQLGRYVGGWLSRIPGLNKLDQQLQFYHNNAPELLSEWAKSPTTGINIGPRNAPYVTGVGTDALKWLKGLVPEFNPGGESFATGGYNGKQESVNFDDLTRRSIIETIPGLLSEILQVAHAINGETTERRRYDPTVGRIVNESTLQTNLKNTIIPTQTAQDIGEHADALMAELTRDLPLSPAATQAVREQMVQNAYGGRRFNPAKWAAGEELERVADPAVREELRRVNTEIPIERLNVLTTAYHALRERIPEMDGTLKAIIANGGRDQLEDLGVLENGRFNANFIFDRIKDGQTPPSGSAPTGGTGPSGPAGPASPAGGSGPQGPTGGTGPQGPLGGRGQAGSGTPSNIMDFFSPSTATTFYKGASTTVNNAWQNVRQHLSTGTPPAAVTERVDTPRGAPTPTPGQPTTTATPDVGQRPAPQTTTGPTWTNLFNLDTQHIQQQVADTVNETLASNTVQNVLKHVNDLGQQIQHTLNLGDDITTSDTDARTTQNVHQTGDTTSNVNQATQVISNVGDRLNALQQRFGDVVQSVRESTSTHDLHTRYGDTANRVIQAIRGEPTPTPDVTVVVPTPLNTVVTTPSSSTDADGLPVATPAPDSVPPVRDALDTVAIPPTIAETLQRVQENLTKLVTQTSESVTHLTEVMVPVMSTVNTAAESVTHQVSSMVTDTVDRLRETAQATVDGVAPASTTPSVSSRAGGASRGWRIPPIPSTLTVVGSALPRLSSRATASLSDRISGVVEGVKKPIIEDGGSIHPYSMNNYSNPLAKAGGNSSPPPDPTQERSDLTVDKPTHNTLTEDHSHSQTHTEERGSGGEETAYRRWMTDRVSPSSDTRRHTTHTTTPTTTPTATAAYGNHITTLSDVQPTLTPYAQGSQPRHTTPYTGIVSGRVWDTTHTLDPVTRLTPPTLYPATTPMNDRSHTTVGIHHGDVSQTQHTTGPITRHGDTTTRTGIGPHVTNLTTTSTVHPRTTVNVHPQPLTPPDSTTVNIGGHTTTHSTVAPDATGSVRAVSPSLPDNARTVPTTVNDTNSVQAKLGDALGKGSRVEMPVREGPRTVKETVRPDTLRYPTAAAMRTPHDRTVVLRDPQSGYPVTPPDTHTVQTNTTVNDRRATTYAPTVNTATTVRTGDRLTYQQPRSVTVGPTPQWVPTTPVLNARSGDIRLGDTTIDNRIGNRSTQSGPFITHGNVDTRIGGAQFDGATTTTNVYHGDTATAYTPSTGDSTHAVNTRYGDATQHTRYGDTVTFNPTFGDTTRLGDTVMRRDARLGDVSTVDARRLGDTTVIDARRLGDTAATVVHGDTTLGAITHTTHHGDVSMDGDRYWTGSPITQETRSSSVNQPHTTTVQQGDVNLTGGDRTTTLGVTTGDTHNTWANTQRSITQPNVVLPPPGSHHTTTDRYTLRQTGQPPRDATVRHGAPQRPATPVNAQHPVPTPPSVSHGTRGRGPRGSLGGEQTRYTATTVLHAGDTTTAPVNTDIQYGANTVQLGDVTYRGDHPQWTTQYAGDVSTHDGDRSSTTVDRSVTRGGDINNRVNTTTSYRGAQVHAPVSVSEQYAPSTTTLGDTTTVGGSTVVNAPQTRYGDVSTSGRPSVVIGAKTPQNAIQRVLGGILPASQRLRERGLGILGVNPRISPAMAGDTTVYGPTYGDAGDHYATQYSTRQQGDTIRGGDTTTVAGDRTHITHLGDHRDGDRYTQMGDTTTVYGASTTTGGDTTASDTVHQRTVHGGDVRSTVGDSTVNYVTQPGAVTLGDVNSTVNQRVVTPQTPPEALRRAVRPSDAFSGDFRVVGVPAYPESTKPLTTRYSASERVWLNSPAVTVNAGMATPTTLTPPSQYTTDIDARRSAVSTVQLGDVHAPVSTTVGPVNRVATTTAGDTTTVYGDTTTQVGDVTHAVGGSTVRGGPTRLGDVVQGNTTLNTRYGDRQGDSHYTVYGGDVTQYGDRLYPSGSTIDLRPGTPSTPRDRFTPAGQGPVSLSNVSNSTVFGDQGDIHTAYGPQTRYNAFYGPQGGNGVQPHAERVKPLTGPYSALYATPVYHGGNRQSTENRTTLTNQTTVYPGATTHVGPVTTQGGDTVNINRDGNHVRTQYTGPVTGDRYTSTTLADTPVYRLFTPLTGAPTTPHMGAVNPNAVHTVVNRPVGTDVPDPATAPNWLERVTQSNTVQAVERTLRDVLTSLVDRESTTDNTTTDATHVTDTTTNTDVQRSDTHTDQTTASTQSVSDTLTHTLTRLAEEVSDSRLADIVNNTVNTVRASLTSSSSDHTSDTTTTERQRNVLDRLRDRVTQRTQDTTTDTTTQTDTRQTVASVMERFVNSQHTVEDVKRYVQDLQALRTASTEQDTHTDTNTTQATHTQHTQTASSSMLDRVVETLRSVMTPTPTEATATSATPGSTPPNLTMPLLASTVGRALGLLNGETTPQQLVKETLARVTEAAGNRMRQADATTQGRTTRKAKAESEAAQQTGPHKSMETTPTEPIEEDVYVGNEDDPRLTRIGFRTQRYRNRETGELVTKYRDLHGTILDAFGNVVLSPQDYPLGLYNQAGDRINAKVASTREEIRNRATYLGQIIGTRANVLKEKFMQGLVGLRGRIDDVYVLGQPEPVITAEKMRQLFYIDRRTKKPIRTIDDIKGAVEDREGNVVLTWDDFDKGLYLKDGTMVHRKGLLYNTGKFINWYFGGYYRNLWKFLTTSSPVTRLIKNIGSRLLGVPDCYVPGEETPRLLARMLRRGMYLSSKTGKRIFRLSQIDSDVLGPDGEVVLTLDEAERGLVDRYGRPVRGLGNRIIRKAFGMVSTPLTKLGRMYSRAGHALGDMAYKGAKGVLGGLKNLGSAARAGFDELTGYRKGSWQEHREQRNAEKAKRKAEKTNRKSKKKKGGLLGILMTVAGVVKVGFDKLLDKLNPLKYLKDILTVTKALGVGGDLLDTLGGRGKLGKAGKVLKKGGGLLKRAGSAVMRTGGRVLGTAGRAAVTAIGAEALVSGAATAATAATGAIGSALTAAGAAVAGFFTLPVLLGAAAVAAVGLGAWYLWRKYGASPDPIQAVRLAEYGIPVDNRDLKAKVLKLEEALKDHVMVRPGQAQFKRSIPIKDIYELFEIDPENEENSQMFLRWFRDRFRPVYLRFAAVGNDLQPGLSVDKLDDKLDDGDKPRLVKETRFHEGDPQYPYNVTDSPEPPAPCDTGTVEIDRAIAAVEAKFGSAARRKHRDTIQKQRRADNDAEAKSGVKAAEAAAARKLANSPDQTYTTEAEVRRREKDATTGKGGVNPNAFDLSKHRKIDELSAVRYRTYGLVDLDRGRVDTLALLEADLRDELVYRGMGQATLDYSPNEMFETYGPRFELNISNTEQRKAWKTWFTERFMPTFLAFATAVHTCASGVALADAAQLLKAEQQVTVAQAIMTAQYTGWFMNTSVWKCDSSPWPDYTLNLDSSSVKPSMDSLKQKVKQEALEEVQNKDKGSAKVGDGSTALKNTGGTDKPYNNGANQDSVSKAIGNMNFNDAEGNTLGNNTPKLPTSDGSSGYAGGGGSYASGPGEVAPGVENDFASSGESTYAADGSAGTKRGRLAHFQKREGGDFRTLPDSKGNGLKNNMDLLIGAAKMAGVDPGTLQTFAGVESGYKPVSPKQDSWETQLAGGAKYAKGARGMFQFIPGTWREMLNKYGHYYNLPTNANVLDPKANALMGAEYMRQNAPILKRLTGHEPTDIELYLGHFLGGKGVETFYGMPENAIPAISMPKEAANNKNIFYTPQGRPRTKPEVYADLDARVRNNGRKHVAEVYARMAELEKNKPAMDDLTGNAAPGSADGNITPPTTVESTDVGGGATAGGSDAVTTTGSSTTTGDTAAGSTSTAGDTTSATTPVGSDTGGTTTSASDTTQEPPPVTPFRLPEASATSDDTVASVTAPWRPNGQQSAEQRYGGVTTLPTEAAAVKQPYYAGQDIHQYLPDGYSDVEYNRTPPPTPLVTPMDTVSRGGADAVAPVQPTQAAQTLSTVAAQTLGMSTAPEKAAAIAAAQPVNAQPVSNEELVSVLQNQLTTQQEIRDLVQDLLAIKQATQPEEKPTTEHVTGLGPQTTTGTQPRGSSRSTAPVKLTRNY